MTRREANELLERVRGKRGKKYDIARAIALNALRKIAQEEQS